ncbi:MAG: HD domain-containing protein [Desulfovibrionaceae bacterium]
MRVLLVGGAVRDLVLGRPVSDKDYLVMGADAAEFGERFPQALPVGKSFPVYWLRGDQFAFLRGASVDEDLLARDFTVNAMALDENGEIYAHPRALEDLDAKALRPCSARSLSDDPLRVFRAARFLAQLSGFKAHPELALAMRREAALGELEGIDAERVGVELRKALQGLRPGVFLRLLSETGCLRPWFEELASAGDIPAGPLPYHDESVLEHTAQVMDRLAGQGELAVFMGLCHDLGKTVTPSDRWPSHHGHDRLGEELASDMALRLRLPSRMEAAGRTAARWHMTAARYKDLRTGTRVDLLSRLHALKLVRETFALVVADRGAKAAGLLERAQADLDAMLAVRLPKADRNRGAASGERLRQLRCEALAHRR